MSLYRDNAELYDIAFDWDIEAVTDWLVDRLRARSVLEPGCGSGRILSALSKRGVEVVGLDNSAGMVAFARRRLGEAALVVEADMTNFDLRRRFEGAVCPINTLIHLTPDELDRHLACMARHLEPGARYLAQVGLIDPDRWEPFDGSHWQATRGRTTLKVDWIDLDLDAARGRSRQRSRIEVLEGDRAGEVIEEVHEMTAWTPETWAAAIDASPFTEVATYDGEKQHPIPRVDSTATGFLLWHELVCQRD